MYTYTIGQNRPLRKCPGCKNHLDREVGDVNIHLTNGKACWETQSVLGAGTLFDPDGEVEEGLHSHTSCGHCGEMLIIFDEVTEEGSWTRSAP